jgi:hypothetical protein
MEVFPGNFKTATYKEDGIVQYGALLRDRNPVGGRILRGIRTGEETAEAEAVAVGFLA